MKESYSSLELAAMRLPGLPRWPAEIDAMAEREGWASRPARGIFSNREEKWIGVFDAEESWWRRMAEIVDEISGDGDDFRYAAWRLQFFRRLHIRLYSHFGDKRVPGKMQNRIFNFESCCAGPMFDFYEDPTPGTLEALHKALTDDIFFLLALENDLSTLKRKQRGRLA